MRSITSVVVGCVSVLLPFFAYAAPRVVNIKTGISTSVTVISVLTGIVDLLLYWGGTISTSVFLLGAFTMTASAGNDEYVSMGKTMMKSAAIGLAIVLASWMILSTVVFFIAGF